uniref:WD repeat-containing protein 55 n=1 Tax=Chenopodium quinoa TaxID=63459 RepID=A0A803LL07_CHEQI
MEIKLGDHPFDVDFHPSDSLVATGLINGYLLLYRYAAEAEPQRLLNVRAHKKSCRTTRFINEGRAIVTGSADCSILATDVETGAKIAHLKNAHTGDGTLSVCSIRSNKVQAQSEFCEDEPLSVVIMKNGRKVICGTQSGTLLLYSWGFFKDCSDRFVDLSPNSVDALLKYDEDRLITGSSNGLISLVGILPNRIIQPIAEHSEYPVERLAFSHDKKLLGSISHDNTLKLWDMDELLQGPSTVTRNDTAADSNSDSDSDGMDVDSDLANASRGTKRKNTGTGNGKASSSSFGSFFEGL